MISTIRVNFIVEGQTEETFVRRILVESLAKSDVYVSGARCIETGRKKIKGLNTTKPGKQELIFRGGMPSFEKIRRDIKLWLDEDRKAYLTTMFETAPSKRILDLFKSYQKVTYGYQIVQQIEIDAIRRECPHFNEWIVKLGQLGIYGQIRS
jgi:hypothetical protein